MELIERLRCKACDAFIRDGGDKELCYHCLQIAISCNSHILIQMADLSTKEEDDNEEVREDN